MARIKVKVKPRASKDEVIGVQSGTVVLRVKAPPADGAANQATIKLLAQRLSLPKSAITIRHGHTSRTKILEVEGLTEAEITGRLCP